MTGWTTEEIMNEILPGCECDGEVGCSAHDCSAKTTRDSLTLTVEFRIADNGRVVVYVDSSLLGTFDGFADAGMALGEDFEYRMVGR